MARLAAATLLLLLQLWLRSTAATTEGGSPGLRGASTHASDTHQDSYQDAVAATWASRRSNISAMTRGRHLDAAEFGVTDGTQRFMFWVDFPGSVGYSDSTHWYDAIQTAAGQSFTQSSYTVNVNWNNKGAIHLYADPAFQQFYDDLIRKYNGAESSTMTGTIDSCGWPDQAPADAPADLQWTRQTTPFFDDFSNGLDPNHFIVSTDSKGCCVTNIVDNVNIVEQVVHGVTKNVLALTAYNRDTECPGPACHKFVSSAGMVSTTGHFASGSYEVVANVPAAQGLVWAMWVFHYEEHLPNDCSYFSCYCGDGAKAGCPHGTCMPSEVYNQDKCVVGPMGQPCGDTTLCLPGWSESAAATCADQHSDVGTDPQFLGSASFSGYRTIVNHEIDIEIPASCMDTPNVCSSGTCEGDYSTANLNVYTYTNNGGVGPSYANMCAKVANADGEPVQLIGDGRYHKYRFDWHTGNGVEPGTAVVDFFVDDTYMGSNNAFVPSRGSRLSLALWGGSWNGEPNNWGGGTPGDGQVYSQTAYVSSVKITPFNEPNDIMYMTIDDQPPGCTLAYDRTSCSVWTATTIPPVVTPAPPPNDDDPTPTDDKPLAPANNDEANDDDTCLQSTHRPNGCPCTSNQQCTNNWCAGLCTDTPM